jgi:hypothetical protein
LIRSPIFALSISPDEEKVQSTIEFGSFDKTFLTQKNYHFQWLNVRSKSSVWWEINLNGASIGDKEIILSA